MTKPISVALVGAGSMGGALLRGWLSAGVIDAPASAVFDPAADKSLARLSREHGFAVNPPTAATSADALVLAIKPQAAASAAPSYASIAKDAIVISVMAGKSLSAIGRLLNSPPRMARAMPNLAASVGAGATGLYAPMLDAKGRDLVDRLMAPAGETIWVDSEAAIDWVTAISGSGPAYYFLLTEALAEAGVALGLDRAAAQRLARATAVGAGALLDAGPKSPADMRKAVTSPGGTTAAALAILDDEDKALRSLVRQAVAAAARRAGELTD